MEILKFDINGYKAVVIYQAKYKKHNPKQTYTLQYTRNNETTKYQVSSYQIALEMFNQLIEKAGEPK